MPRGAGEGGHAGLGARAAPQNGRTGAGRKAKRGSVCQNCASVKAKCDGCFPCDRCFRMNKPCRPQVFPTDPPPQRAPGPSSEPARSRRRPRPATSSNGECDEEEEVSLGSKDGEHTSSGGGGSGGDGALVQADDGGGSSPLLDLVIDRMAPRKFAEIYMMAFSQLHAEGLISRRKMVTAVRFWRAFSLAIGGADPTHGICGQVERALGIGREELEDPAALAYAAPAHALRKRFQQEAMATGLYAERTLKASDAFRFSDDGRRGVYLTTYTPSNNIAAATNAAYAAMWKDGLEMHNDTMRKSTINALLIGSVVAPCDRLEFFRGLLQVGFSTVNQRSTGVLKMFDKDGEIRIYLVEARPVCVDGQFGTIALYEPCPPTRYVSTRTDFYAPPLVSECGRRRPMTSQATGAGAGRRPPVPPALTALTGIQLHEDDEQRLFAKATSPTSTALFHLPALEDQGEAEAEGGGGGGGPRRRRRLRGKTPADPAEILAPQLARLSPMPGHAQSSSAFAFQRRPAVASTAGVPGSHPAPDDGGAAPAVATVVVVAAATITSHTISSSSTTTSSSSSSDDGSGDHHTDAPAAPPLPPPPSPALLMLEADGSMLSTGSPMFGLGSGESGVPDLDIADMAVLFED